MEELNNKRIEELVTTYLNGNKKDLRQAIKGMNKLQIANFIMRADMYGMPRHTAYVQIQLALNN